MSTVYEPTGAVTGQTSNRIATQPACTSASYQVISEQAQLEQRYADFISDESNTAGALPQAICLPTNWQEVSAYLAEGSAAKTQVVLAGALTGLTGGAIGLSEAQTLSLRRLSTIQEGSTAAGTQDEVRLRVGAGVTLRELQEHIALAHPDYWFPVDPTETSASFGGMVAVSASGARGYRYGSIRRWVEWIRVVLADGEVLEIPRGQYFFRDGKCYLQKSAGEVVLTVETTAVLPDLKATIGYPLSPEMDLIDLFIGSEGTLGVITDVEIRVVPRPPHFLYVLQFFEDEMQALDLVSAVDTDAALMPLAIESCDGYALRLIEGSAQRADSRAIQQIRSEHQAAVFLEFAAESEEAIEAQLMDYLSLAERLGVPVEDCLAGGEPKDLRDMKLFRHAIPETVNSIIRMRKQDCPALHKLALDMAVPKTKRNDVYRLYQRTFLEAGLEFTIFGHAGDAHYHVNILARDERELQLAKRLYVELAAHVVSLGGSIAAEHGIGRIKRHLLPVQHDAAVLANFVQIRRSLDPAQRLAPGVLVD